MEKKAQDPVKKWLTGIVIGAICIFGEIGVKEWLRTKIATGSLNSTTQKAITTVQRYTA